MTMQENTEKLAQVYPLNDSPSSCVLLISFLRADQALASGAHVKFGMLLTGHDLYEI